jgi:hypothetical protein
MNCLLFIDNAGAIFMGSEVVKNISKNCTLACLSTTP